MIKLCGLEDLRQYQEDSVAYHILTLMDNFTLDTKAIMVGIVQTTAWNCWRSVDFIAGDNVVAFKGYVKPCDIRDDHGMNIRAKLFV